MTRSPETILITSSVVVAAPFTRLDGADDRVRLTLSAIEHWIGMPVDLQIVLCDGSGYDFSEVVAERFPDSQIECLSFRNSFEKVSTYGKGYGEGEIIKYAIENSTFIRDCDYFVKITSKFWVRNFGEILKHWNNQFQCDVFFEEHKSVKHIISRFIDTRFYIVNKFFYQRYLQSAHLAVRDNHAYYLENSFRDAIVRERIQFSKILFPIPALIEGVSGTSGEKYSTTSPTRIQRIRRLGKRLVLRINELFFKIQCS